MSRRLWWWLVLFGALVLAMPQAMAQRPPETHPTDEHRDIVMSWDRSAMPGDIVFWRARSLLAYDPDSTGNPYAQTHLVCTSSVDSTHGRCPIEGTDEPISGFGEIRVRATERRSGMQTDVALLARLQRPMNGFACQYWYDVNRPLWSSRLDRCGPDSPAGIGVEMHLPATELVRLVAGHWDSEVRLMLRDVSGLVLATYSFSLDFNITDYDAVSIYLPEFQEAAPTVGLNLSYDPIARTVGGRAHLDMCLYDGLGSQSEYLGVTVRDSGTRPPGPTGYSIWHTDGAGGDSQRMDYTVTLDHNGARIPMRNGVEEQLRNIDTARLRLVMLPGMSQPVFCVPTPLTLDTPRVPIDEKRSGAYQGDLKVELRLPTSRP